VLTNFVSNLAFSSSACFEYTQHAIAITRLMTDGDWCRGTYAD